LEISFQVNNAVPRLICVMLGRILTGDRSARGFSTIVRLIGVFENVKDLCLYGIDVIYVLEEYLEFNIGLCRSFLNTLLIVGISNGGGMVGGGGGGGDMDGILFNNEDIGDSRCIDLAGSVILGIIILLLL